MRELQDAVLVRALVQDDPDQASAASALLERPALVPILIERMSA
ncbi:hypothetical protein [Synechococcus sp. CBW1006]|nr:hypothetical protein [Synechococcus sp. CBW1006]